MNAKQFQEEFHVSFLADEDPITKQPIEHNFSKDDFELLPSGDTLFKLAAKSKIEEIYDTIEDGKGINIAQLTQEILSLSVTYQVLTKETAFIGVIKQDDKVIGELTKVVIPTSLAEDSSSLLYRMRKPAAAPMGMMRKKATLCYSGGSNFRGGIGGIQHRSSAIASTSTNKP